MKRNAIRFLLCQSRRRTFLRSGFCKLSEKAQAVWAIKAFKLARNSSGSTP